MAKHLGVPEQTFDRWLAIGEVAGPTHRLRQKMYYSFEDAERLLVETTKLYRLPPGHPDGYKAQAAGVVLVLLVRSLMRGR